MTKTKFVMSALIVACARRPAACRQPFERRRLGHLDDWGSSGDLLGVHPITLGLSFADRFTPPAQAANMSLGAAKASSGPGLSGARQPDNPQIASCAATSGSRGDLGRPEDAIDGHDADPQLLGCPLAGDAFGGEAAGVIGVSALLTRGSRSRMGRIRPIPPLPSRARLAGNDEGRLEHRQLRRAFL